MASILVILVGFFWYQTFKPESIDTAIRVKNGTQDAVEAIGVYGDNKLIFCRTEGNIFAFPKKSLLI